MKVRKVRVNTLHGRLCLRWVCPVTEKCRSVAIGVADSTAGRAQAELLKDRIENDQKYGRYDATLVSYRPKTIGRSATEISAPELFDRFTRHQAKQKGLAESSIDSRYHPVKRYLQQYLDRPVNEVGKRETERIAAICGDQLTASTAKERLALLKNCWDWAVGKYAVAQENPWAGLGARFRPKPVQKSKPFTAAEVVAIINAFRQHPRYHIYGDFISTLFGTGARFGEIAGLRWKHIADDFSSIWIGESLSRGRRGATKTKKERTVLIGPALAEMLRSRKKLVKPKPDELVFARLGGGAIDDNYFRKNPWKIILASLNIPYRKTYTTRHTQLSHQLAAGLSPIAVAESAGNSPRMLYQHYASVINKQSVLIDFSAAPTSPE
jgi:integrase